MDHNTGKSRGFGFVTFATEAAMNNALELAGSVLNLFIVFIIGFEWSFHQSSEGWRKT